MDYLVLPKNLDLEKEIKENPPFKARGFRFNIQHCKEIVSLIYSIPAEKPWIKVRDGYVPLSGKMLSKKYRGYKNYLIYLFINGILESDNHYKTGKKCRGFRFTERYLTEPVFLYSEPPQQKKLREKHLSEEELVTCGHLVKWFNSSLQIKYEEALKYVENMAESAKEEFNITKDAHSYRGKLCRLSRAKIAIERIHRQTYRFSMGPKSNRFYSTLTGMPKDVRRFLTYNGQTLIGIDLRNSQPFLLLAILDQKFWEPKPDDDRISLFDLYNEDIFGYVTDIINSKHKTIMVDSLGSSDFQREIKLYSELVSKGELYALLEKGQTLAFGWTWAEEKYVKADFLKALFADNRYFGNSPAMHVFKMYFPNIYSFICGMKRIHKKKWAHLMQHVESVIFLSGITKRISEEFPKLAIYTIHDNIATTAENVNCVKQIMEDELTKYIGFKPSFGDEEWSLDNEKLTYSYFDESLYERMHFRGRTI